MNAEQLVKVLFKADDQSLRIDLGGAFFPDRDGSEPIRLSLFDPPPEILALVGSYVTEPEGPTATIRFRFHMTFDALDLLSLVLEYRATHPVRICCRVPA